MKSTWSRLFCCVAFLFALFSVDAQTVKIDLGNSEIAVNQYYTITVTIENERLKNYSPFPEIPGLAKRGTSSSTSTSFVNGRMSSSQSITQNYQPQKEGTFTIPSFTMKVNGKEFSSPGGKIKVGPAVQRRRQDPYDPFDFFNRRRKQPAQPQEFVDVEAEAFLSLSTDKSEVYVGEGFTTSLIFYVAESNRAEMRFFELGKQISDIVKKIKPSSCWEENFDIDNINGQPVTLRGKPYTQYKIFQATYFPLNEEDIDFESVGLKLIKYKVAKNQSFFSFGRSRKEDFQTFYSRPRKIKVTPLPSHPLSESVSVGSFRLKEDISTKQLQTGQSFNYSFDIIGRGNISSIEAPRIPENKNFDFYEPNIQQNVRRAQNTVTGTKAFSYYGIPNEPGEFDLGDYMSWVYFDPEREVYDTLKSRFVLQVVGESKKNEAISANDLGSFYDSINDENNTLRSLSRGFKYPWVANILLITIFATSAFFVFRR